MDVEISAVVPVKDEAGNVAPLLREIADALKGEKAEIIFIDDASGDTTAAELLATRAEIPILRVLQHTRNAGQSAAVRTGVTAARGRLVVTLDGDGQNNPADVPKLIAAYRAQGPGANIRMVAGQRVGRKDTAIKKITSRFANRLRRWALNDATRDTGCGLKLFEREAFLRLPYFDHIHRYLPALMKREGYGVALVDVSHRPRGEGRSKYGTLDRALVGIRDLMGVMWLMQRRRMTGEVKEL